MLFNDLVIKLNTRVSPTISKNKKYLGLVVLLIILFPVFIFPIDRLKNSLKLLAPISDGYYFERVFFAKNKDWTVGNPLHFVEATNIAENEIVSIGESIQRLLYIALGYNIILTYLVFSLVCLFFIFVFLINTLNIENKNFRVSVIATLIGFFLLFSRFSPIPSDSLQFSRMISPQFPILLWSFEIYLIAKILRSISYNKSYFLTHISFTFLTVISLYVHYPYLFLSSIFAFFLLQIKVLLVTKEKIFVFLNFLILLLGCLPQVFHLFKFRNTPAYKETLVRIGLIDIRFPGSLYIIVATFFILILIKIIEKNIFNFPLGQVKVNFLVLKITTVSILLASQSHLITGKAVQFSDHFNILMNINLIILLGIVFLLIENSYGINLKISKKINLSTKFWKNTKIIGTGFLIIVAYSNLNGIKEPMKYTSFQSQVTSIFEKYGVRNVIVDENNLQHTIGAISGSKVFYSSTLSGYGFTNKEVLERFLISKGCPSNLSQSEKDAVYFYTVAASEQKINRIAPLLRVVDFELFNKYLESSKIKLNIAKKNVNAEIDEYLIANKVNCFELAKSFIIDAIIYNSDSQWGSILPKDEFPIFKFDNGILLAVFVKNK